MTYYFTMVITKIRKKNLLGFYFVLIASNIYKYLKFKIVNDKRYVINKFYRLQEYHLNLENPKTLNEKLQWLKLYDRRPIYTQQADKYLVREFIESIVGKQYLIPLEFKTQNTKDIVPKNLPNYPFIIKANHDSGSYIIVRNKADLNWKQIQLTCKWWMSNNYYYSDREWQYKYIKPMIIVEKLLLDKNGRIPNDYKVNCINGEVAFIYVSIDREGINKRNIYDKNWNPLYFTWTSKHKKASQIRGNEIQPPQHLSEMIQVAKKISKDYPYIRIDFYDLEERLYIGEITHCHGGGFDQMRPLEWDYTWGAKMKI